MSASEWITAIVALYGAVLSTVVLLRQLARSRRKLKISLRIGVGIPAGQSPVSLLVLVVRNPGDRAVTLASIRYELEDGQYLDVPLAAHLMPYELGEGKSYSLPFPVVEASRVLVASGYAGVVKLRGLVSDGSGLSFRSKYLKFDTDYWNKS